MQESQFCDLFFRFLRLGITAFGGPAVVVYIKNLAMERKWLDEGDFDKALALLQFIPGATGMQLAAYVGLRVQGIKGAFAAFVGFGSPAFIFMIILSFFYSRYRNINYIYYAFSAFQVIITAMIANATIILARGIFRKPIDLFLTFIAAILLFFNVAPLLVIIFGGSLGLILLRPDIPIINPHLTGINRFYGKQLLAIFIIIAVFLLSAYFANSKLFHIALVMLKIDCLAFGGGFGALPIMFHEVVNNNAWMTPGVFMDGIALGQITPGPIIVTGAFVGYMVDGLKGVYSAQLEH